ncbi:hypothetical protein [Novosphingobium album (ex Hu et al. 2023)]|uniref:MFS transporter n=1 Tax=Novosphingobium album (ex Hu et al. 2023) TaxID=2930093 RepID=A0ABT0B2X9_9SPHN|nr:hypothetical protein [Novosphingobium album (ex Hu et al. 2023)]MCJ2179392.1 hypothetical protein [Novosphingobium album (ex Hu et al. 2023)]
MIMAWVAMASAAITLMSGEGAWGLAAGTTATMASASLVLAHAALTTPPPGCTTRDRVALPLPPVPVSWPDACRRLGVFGIVVVLDLAASLWLAWTVQRALFRAGISEANTTALALFLCPLLWLAAASWQMICTRLAAMAMAPLAALILGSIVWLTV